MQQTDLPFLNAYTFGFCEKRGFTRSSGWKWSLAEMKRTTGCNAIILPVCAWQDHTYSTWMDSDHPDVMDEEDVRAVCQEARALGLKVLLKAMVNCRDGYWRAYIHFFDQDVPTEPGWADWFASWEDHVCRVARMAEENQAEMFCIGCEMVGTDGREAEWRQVAAHVRQIYSGPITYNCDKFQEGNVHWWDAVDYISSSGYYPIHQLEENFARIQSVCQREGKPFLFMECGCPSRGKSEYRPNDWRFGEGTDLTAQTRWYEAFLEALKRNPWVRGTGWWDWSATRLYPAQTAQDNNGYCTYGKPANDALLRFSGEI
ncbi:MAG: 1,4-beta-xylanase [Clostridia bacterium]|nr:1,4-beta-xylanase [Clostridia bacterium]